LREIGMMPKSRRRLLSVGALLVVLAGGATLASAAAPDRPAGSDTGAVESDEGVRDDDARDTAITGDPLARASAAALAHTGGGRVTGTEVDDEESYYEVEVTLDDGRQVDVQLDRAFNVVGGESDRGADRD
jgi:uncharacterized membrane protein YkoI